MKLTLMTVPNSHVLMAELVSTSSANLFAPVLREHRDTCVTSTKMTASKEHATTEAPALTESTATTVNVHQDMWGQDAREM